MFTMPIADYMRQLRANALDALQQNRTEFNESVARQIILQTQELEREAAFYQKIIQGKTECLCAMVAGMPRNA